MQFVGAVSDPRPELERASLLLHCAEREPFGLVLVEALAAGRPVVAPAAAGPLEILDPSCGILYPPGDGAAAAAAIVSLLEAPERARRMGLCGRARATEQFQAGTARAQFAGALAPLVRPRAASRTAPASDLPAIVTVTHNSAAALNSLLRSVRMALGSACTVIVVDNASRDETLTVARRWRAELAVEVLALPENIGFGAACNRGVALVDDHDVTALLNPDVELLDRSLLTLAAQARAAGPPRLLAPLVLGPDGRRENSVHTAPCSAAAVAHALVPPAALPARAAAAFAPWRSGRPRAVGWAVGCALVARTGTLRSLGPFDASIFLYAEDMDLCLRAREHGVETWFIPAARVLHHGGHSTSAAFGGEPLKRLAQARHDVVARRLGRRSARADDGLQALTFGSRMMLKRVAGRPAAREREQLRALATVRRRPAAGASE